MNDTRPLSIPVILGTPRQGRLSQFVAALVVDGPGKRKDVQASIGRGYSRSHALPPRLRPGHVSAGRAW